MNRQEKEAVIMAEMADKILSFGGICGFVITNNDLEIGEYSYLVSKSSCYDTAETKNVFKYRFYKTLD